MYKNSIFIKFILYLLKFFKESYENSFLKKLGLFLYNFLYIILIDSFIVRLFKDKEKGNKKFDSIIIKIFDSLYSFFVNFANKIFNNYKDGSKFLLQLDKIRGIYNFYLIAFNFILGVGLIYIIFAFLFIETSVLYGLILIANFLLFIFVNSKEFHFYIKNSLVLGILKKIINIFILE